MISVDEAVARIAKAFAPLPSEAVPLEGAFGRILAEDAIAKLDQPPEPVSAMDGYAVRADEATQGAELAVIGESPAGRPFPGRLGTKTAVRILTGGVVPDGADTILIQENVSVLAGSSGSQRSRDGSDRYRVLVREAPKRGENIRRRGLDFRAGEILFSRGHRLSARDLALVAAADTPSVAVTRKPRIALFATGDELTRPGEPRKQGGVVASSIYALAAMMRNWGADASDMGILPDKMEAFAGLRDAAKKADLIVTQGGASVGDHDLVQAALQPLGFVLDFWKIAMRPGKPLIFGRLHDTPFIGLPGNPVSAMVCAILFIQPAVASMLGTPYRPRIMTARLASPLPANGSRQDYLRAATREDGAAVTVDGFALQDSSMQKTFAQADGLIVRPAGAPAAQIGDTVEVLLLDQC